MSLDFDPFDPGFVADPYPTYARLRREAPVFWHEPTNRWYLMRHAPITAVLRDQRFGRSYGNTDVKNPAFRRMQEGKLLNTDPPEHTRLRTTVNHLFTPRKVEAFRPRLRKMANELLDGPIHDLIDDYAAIVPVAMIGELLGVPKETWPRLRPWANATLAMFDFAVTPETERRGEVMATEFRACLEDLVAYRKRHPGDDIITGLMQQGLSDNEVIVMAGHLLVAGQEATVNSLGNGVYALMQSRDQWDRLRSAPALVPTAIEELLRYDTPLQHFQRTAWADVDLEGHQIKQGDRVHMFYGSANHDEALFVEPERLDVTRNPNPHLVFGMGIHFCIGAPLARLEFVETLTALIERRPDLELDGPPVRRSGTVPRAFDHLPVR
ncbi:MAG: cytochrome P450 [Chloroflexi bacterium]|nr:cytochrome P450 [Chloroflexota bacterium]